MSKTSSFLLGVAITLCVSLVVGYFVDKNYYKDKKVWQAQMDERAEKERLAREEAEKYKILSAQHLALADEWHLKADDFQTKWKIALGQAAYWKGQADTLPPTEVVSETVKHLDVPMGDVRLMASGMIEFTLSAARVNLDNLFQFKLVLTPAFDALMKEAVALRKENGELRLSIGECNFSLSKCEEERSDLGKDKVALTEQLARCESGRKWKFGFNLKTLEHVGIPVVSFILGVAVGK